VAVGVVEDGAVDEVTPVEPLHGVPVKADPDRSPGAPGEDAAHPGEELAVDDGVEAHLPHAADRGQAVPRKPAKRDVAQRHDVFRRDDLEKVQDLAVLLEDQGVDRGLRVLLPKPPEHGGAEHEAPHLRKQNDQDSPRRPCRRPASREQGEQPADQRPERLVDSSLRFDVHFSLISFPFPLHDARLADRSPPDLWEGNQQAGERPCSLSRSSRNA